MKNYVKLLAITVAVFAVNSVKAQDTGFKYGSRFGIGSASFVSDGNNSFKSKLLLQAGIASSYMFSKNVGLMADVLFTSKGSKNSGVTTENTFGVTTEYPYSETYNFYYAEIPFMGRIQFGTPEIGFKVYAGPSYNFKLAATETRKYDNESYNNNNGYEAKEIEDLDVAETALVVGGGIDVYSNGGIYFIDVRYSRGTNYFRLFNNSEAFTSYFSINIGQLF